MKEANEILKIIYDALDDKKAEDIRIIKISEITSIGDYLVIASGSSNNQLQALCDNVEDELHKSGVKLRSREGNSNGGWILLDYYDIIIHIFSKDEREFYDLEHIWRDGETVTI